MSQSKPRTRPNKILLQRKKKTTGKPLDKHWKHHLPASQHPNNFTPIQQSHLHASVSFFALIQIVAWGAYASVV
ncbi:hypothetical protein IAQ61_010668 [Plenodomus lingam]|uniref:uncharacterized protein n=1 Tax=Leptosphaeria maculans TaxID=5022 RepID=UPI003324002A|nr:hypothetical protein IAQ61_010668 [Plenodomus lingam]